MACKTCGHTKSSPCACNDRPLQMSGAGLYTDCKDNTNNRGQHALPEPCDELTCTECVRKCNCCKEMDVAKGRDVGIVALGQDTGTESGAIAGYAGEYMSVETKGGIWRRYCGEHLEMTIQRLMLYNQSSASLEYGVPYFIVADKYFDQTSGWNAVLQFEGWVLDKVDEIQVWILNSAVSDDWIYHNAPGTGNLSSAQLASGDFLSYTLSGLSPSTVYSVKLVTITNEGDVFDPASVKQSFVTRDCSND